MGTANYGCQSHFSVRYDTKTKVCSKEKTSSFGPFSQKLFTYTQNVWTTLEMSSFKRAKRAKECVLAWDVEAGIPPFLPAGRNGKIANNAWNFENKTKNEN